MFKTYNALGKRIIHKRIHDVDIKQKNTKTNIEKINQKLK